MIEDREKKINIALPTYVNKACDHNEKRTIWLYPLTIYGNKDHIKKTEEVGVRSWESIVSSRLISED